MIAEAVGISGSMRSWSRRAMDFYWGKKRKFIRSCRRRGIDFRLVPRVPSVGVTGSVGKTTTCRMVAHILSSTGLKVALATTQGMYVGQELIRAGDLAGGDSAGRLLLESGVQAGVFEFARGGLLSDGMVLSAIDIGAVVNVYDNHIGLNGVHDRQGLARVKGEVVRNARRLAVLNADDPMCLELTDVVSVPLCLAAMDADNPALRRHLRAGGLAAFVEDGHGGPRLYVRAGRLEIGALDASKIPATHCGVFSPAVHNALFAAAIAHGLGVDWGNIREALYSFHSTCETNPGRMNFLAGFPFEVLLTWADGPQALAGLSRFARGCSGVNRKHLMFCAAGNRPDWFVRDSAAAVAGVFDSYICSDWDALRGRAPLEAARLLAGSLLDSGVPPCAVSVAQTHDDALRLALARPRPGDLLVLVTYSYRRAREIAGEACPGVSGQSDFMEKR